MYYGEREIFKVLIEEMRIKVFNNELSLYTHKMTNFLKRKCSSY